MVTRSVPVRDGPAGRTPDRIPARSRCECLGVELRSMVNRLLHVLSGAFPALERTFHLAHSHGVLILLTGYQAPAIRRVGSRGPILAGQAEGPQG